MEDVNQSYGYILYRTTIGHAQSAELRIEELHSYAQIYLDGELVGTLDRRLNQSTLPIHTTHDNTRLDILVENTGRVNYGREFVNERAGITHRVTLGDATLDRLADLYAADGRRGAGNYDSDTCTGACFYRGTFYVAQPADTFVDMSQFGKGVVWVNGRLIGRFWNIGPQRTLYVPSTIIDQRGNDIEIFDLNGQPGRTVHFLNKAILDDNK